MLTSPTVFSREGHVASLRSMRYTSERETDRQTETERERLYEELLHNGGSRASPATALELTIECSMMIQEAEERLKQSQRKKEAGELDRSAKVAAREAEEAKRAQSAARKRDEEVLQGEHQRVAIEVAC